MMIKKKENPSASLLELLANKLVAKTIGRRNKIELIDLFDRFIMVIPYVNNDFFLMHCLITGLTLKILQHRHTCTDQ